MAAHATYPRPPPYYKLYSQISAAPKPPPPPPPPIQVVSRASPQIFQVFCLAVGVRAGLSARLKTVSPEPSTDIGWFGRSGQVLGAEVEVEERLPSLEEFDIKQVYTTPKSATQLRQVVTRQRSSCACFRERKSTHSATRFFGKTLANLVRQGYSTNVC